MSIFLVSAPAGGDKKREPGSPGPLAFSPARSLVVAGDLLFGELAPRARAGRVMLDRVVVLRDILEKAKGCHLEIIMKDHDTIQQDPSRAIAWCKLAKEEISRYYK
jgi:hypothetical protein